MAKNNLMDLIKHSLRVESGVVTISNNSKELVLDLSDLVPKYNGYYSIEGKTICFVYNNEIYVTPFTRVTQKTLIKSGFMKENFIVPFENGSYPKQDRLLWLKMREKARLSYIKDFEDDCIEYSNSHCIGEIPKEFLDNSLEIPPTGIQVSHNLYDTSYNPIIVGYNFDFVAINNIGKFCANDDKVIYVYRNGKTYVTKGYKIIPELLENGYSDSCFRIPFAKGEEIIDPIIREKWKSIKKLSLVK